MIQVSQMPRTVSRETMTTIVAVLGSLLINGVLLILAGVWALFQEQQRLAVPAPQAEEFVVSLEELLPEIIAQEVMPAPEPAAQAFVETFTDQETQQRPDRAPFESDRNTRAATKVVPDQPGELPVPTQEGLKEIKGISMREHNFAAGPDGAIPRSTPTPPGMPVVPGMVKAPDAMTTPQPDSPPEESVPAKEKAEPTEKTSPTETKVVAKPDTGRAEEAPDPTDIPEGKAGGVPDRMEMAKVDLPARARELTGDELDESMAPRADEDAMPEKAPQLADPMVSILQAPRVRATAPVAKAAPPKPPAPPSMPIPPGAAPRPLTNGEADMAAFSPSRRLNTMKGSLTNSGENAVDAESTPVGMYKAAVSRAIERRWHELRHKNASFVSYGSLKIRFFVNRRGNVSGVRVVHQDAGAVLTNFSIAAVTSALIPAMPEEVAEAFDNEPLEVNYDILIY
jgi:hypothetical protein